MLRPLVSRFMREKHGNFAMIAALASPVLMLLGAGAMDIARYRGAVDELQNVADFAAIAGAREMILANSSKTSIESQVNNVITSRMSAKFNGQPFNKTVDVKMDDNEVHVLLSFQVNGMLGQNLFPENGLVKSDSIAVATSQTQICAITLDDSENKTFMLDDEAILRAEGCSMYANSEGPEAIFFNDASEVLADMICASGGITNESAKSEAILVDGCPPAEDPLKDRRAPNFSNACDEVNFELASSAEEASGRLGDGISDFLSDIGIDTSDRLRPGVYCGGIYIGKHVEATFDPGIYIIRDGSFIVDEDARVRGEGVGFYFTGEDAYFDFRKNAGVRFGAPETGDMAGMLFMEDRDQSDIYDFRISTHLAKELLGTIYLPIGRMYVDAEQQVGDESAFTVLVVNELLLKNSPSLYLNTDYADTNVPVPDGVGPVAGSAYLRN